MPARPKKHMDMGCEHYNRKTVLNGIPLYYKNVYGAENVVYNHVNMAFKKIIILSLTTETYWESVQV